MELTFATLYKKLDTGKIKQWSIKAVEVFSEDLKYIYGNVVIQHGFTDGKLQMVERLIREGKNIGKGNETTPYNQAILEADSKWKKQIDSGYVTELHGETTLVLPMLAQKFQDAKHTVKWPCLIQPKMNGVRCLAKKVSEAEMDYRSKKGKSYNGSLAHLTPHLLAIMEVGEIRDGEVYIHGMSLQKISSLVKKYRKGESEKLEFWNYDIADGTMDNYARQMIILQTIPKNHANLTAVPTAQVYDEKDVRMFHDKWVAEGFEGAIVRQFNGMYAFNGRVSQLLKFKDFEDKEVEIIGGYDGKGLEEGCVIFRVRDEKGNEFSSRPRGTRELRRQWFRELDSLIGKQLTIRFKDLSDDGVPQINVGIAIRDYE